MPCDQIGKVKMIQETAVFLELKKLQKILSTRRSHSKREILSVDNYICFSFLYSGLRPVFSILIINVSIYHTSE